LSEAREAFTRRYISQAECWMPRYLVEREFPDLLTIPIDAEGASMIMQVVNTNSVEGVTWLQSYVSRDHRKSYCVYDGPSADAVRRVAARNQLPVDEVIEVQVLDPYFYR
jgi:hypothetical protein